MLTSYHREWKAKQRWDIVWAKHVYVMRKRAGKKAPGSRWHPRIECQLIRNPNIIISVLYQARFRSHLGYRNSNDLLRRSSFVCGGHDEFCMQGATPLSRAHRIQKLPRRTVLIALIEIYSPLHSNAPRFPNATLNSIRLMNKRASIVSTRLVMYACLRLCDLVYWIDAGRASSIIDLARTVSSRSMRPTSRSFR